MENNVENVQETTSTATTTASTNNVKRLSPEATVLLSVTGALLGIVAFRLLYFIFTGV